MHQDKLREAFDESMKILEKQMNIITETYLNTISKLANDTEKERMLDLLEKVKKGEVTQEELIKMMRENGY